MDSNAFRKHGKEMVDLVAGFWESLAKRRPLPSVKPGFIAQLVPSNPPSSPESWLSIFKDIEPVVLDANTNWHHPRFFAYFPTACSYQAIMGDILSGGIASIGFSWKSSPSMTELELRMTDWIAKLLRIPDFFLNDHDGPGGGIIQSTASDATLIAILAARGRAIERLKEKEQACRNTELLSPKENRHQSDIGDVILPGFHDPNYFTKLIAYCSDQAHSSVDKDAMLAGVRLRKLRTHRSGPQDNYVVRAETLQTAIKVDTENGLVPFIFVATIGTTPTCAVDPIEKLGPICNDNNIWLHVDSAYAGSFLICPEYEYLSKGLEFADSFNTNVHKALQINFDCSPMWFKDAKNAVKYFDVEPVYLKHEYQSKAVDYRHLQIALGRRFRSLKIWFVIRNIGVANLQEHLRKMCQLAEYFEDLILKSRIFELFVPRHLGLVCFRMKNSTNVMNEELNDAVNNDGRIHIVPSTAHNSYFLRFAICSTKTTREDVADSCQILEEYAKKIIEKYRKQKNS